MLYRLIIQNYKSFKDRSELSMIPEPDNRHASYVGSDIPVLRDTIVYGANASGKSNLIKALSFFRLLITDPDVLTHSNNSMFKLDKDSINSPTLLLAEIRLEESLYQYAIVASLKEGKILVERLKEYRGGKWNSIFIREYSSVENRNTITLAFDEKTTNASRYEIYKQDMSKSFRKTVLAELAEKDLTGDHFIDCVNAIYRWFLDLIIIFPETKYNLLGTVAKNFDAVNDLYKKYFEIFGIDIEEIRMKEVDQKYLQLPDSLVSDILSDLLKDKKREGIAMLHGNEQDYLVTLAEEGGLKFSEVSFVHRYKDQDTLFSISEESDGTQRLFDLIPMLGYIITSDRVAVIDEIDRSLHSLLTREMFRIFIEKSVEKHSQLICTTHQVLLMDLNLLGRKEIWFVEKKNKESKLYPLDQYKFDGESINLADNYLIGRFGAIPRY